MLLVVLAWTAPLAAQSTQPVWWPPFTMYGHPVSSPYFDFPTWARYSYCRPAPLAWGYDPFPNYGPCDGAPFAAPTVACEPGFVAHRPVGWYGSADFAPLRLDYLNGFPLAAIGPTTLAGSVGPVVLSTEDLQPEFSASGKYTFGRRIFDCYRLEGTYTGYASWNDQRLVTNTDTNALGGTGNLSTFLSGFSIPPTAGLDGANFAAAAMRSNFQSGELNLLYWGDMPPGPMDVSFLVGLRYMRIQDQFLFASMADLPAGGTTVNLDTNTLNNLWGAQIGIAFDVLVTTRWWLNVTAKGGIFNDHVQMNSLADINGTQGLVTDTRNRTAWLGDISMVANWQITPAWVFRAGYQVMFVNGIALAKDQALASFFTNTTGPLNDSGRIAYHGPLLGLMYNW
jgi:hypothetical protein